MNAKKILLLSVLFLAVSVQAYSQQRRQGPGRGVRSETMIAEMKERLDLSDEQLSKVREIYKKSGAEFGKLREDNTLSDEQRREKLMELRKKQQEEIDAVLTEEQRKELKAWREERQGQRRRPERNQPGNQ
ncbi:MAG TPA: hypothetical protein VD772_04915 [Anseongella sp.]|nr:hypothetical protein [Anseongella sp.]